MTTAATNSATAADSITKKTFSNDKKSTLPDHHSNPANGGAVNGPIMWAEPFPNGEGARSAGTEEPVIARGVTGGVAAQQTRMRGRPCLPRTTQRQRRHA